MSKDWRGETLPSIATQRRVDPDPVPHKKAGRTRKGYPPCWEVRHSGYSYWLTAHRVRPAIPYYWGVSQDDRPNRKDLVAYLAWFAERQPHTATLPVRFISCPAVECGREIIPN
jgi:hypothetical protein